MTHAQAAVSAVQWYASACRRGATELVTSSDLAALTALRDALVQALAGSGADPGCVVDLHLATDEIASVLFGAAHRHGVLSFDTAIDDDDVYVRLSVPCTADDFRPWRAELTRMLLDATTDAYEIRQEGATLFAVFQRALDSTRS